MKKLSEDMISDIMYSLTKCRAVLGDAVRDGRADDDETEAYREACDTLKRYERLKDRA
jgi:hypothetical protein